MNITQAKGAKRRRTGCTRCRASHNKCDERQPCCSRCQRLGLDCEPADFIIPSAWCSSIQGAATTDERTDSGPGSTWEIFNTAPPPVASPHPCEPPSLDGDKVALLQEFQNGVGKWVDLFDEEMHFQRAVVKRALASPLLMNAICALTARQVSMIDKAELWKSAAVRYYADSLHYLVTTLSRSTPASGPIDTLAATILLSSYELLVLPGLDHRRHVSGALTLIKTYGCNAASKGIVGAAFWVYARQDLAMALAHECATMLPPEEWGVSWNEHETREDRLGNQVIWILARIIAHTYGGTEGMGVDSLRDTRSSLITELDAWLRSLPDSFIGTEFGPPSTEGFVKRWFSIPSTAAAMCMHHLGRLLLLAEGCNSSLSAQDGIQSDIDNHARSIASIAFSPISDGALVQAVQPLYYAAKHLQSVAGKVKIWVLLDRIESQLGFHTSDRIKRLQQQVKMC